MRGRVSVLPLVAFAALASCRDAPNAPLDAAPAAASDAALELDADGVKAMSHALFDAYDRADEPVFTRALGPTFSLFQEGHATDRDSVLMRLRRRRERGAPARSRTYGEEKVSVGGGAAVFIGSSIEHLLPDGDHPTGDFEGWNTIVWVRGADGWKAAHWQWEKGGLAAVRDEWNAVYRAGRDFNPKPNQFLVDTVKGRKPGLALDVAMGQGRNAVYLASQGWRVTGIDISEEGLRLARQAAAERKLSIEAINADDGTWDYGVEKWDLITLIYAGGDDPKKIDEIRRGLKRGGLVVVEGFHKDASRSAGATGFEAGQLTAAYREGFAILKDEAVEDVSDWSMGKRTKVVRFAAEKK